MEEEERDLCVFVCVCLCVCEDKDIGKTDMSEIICMFFKIKKLGRLRKVAISKDCDKC